MKINVVQEAEYKAPPTVELEERDYDEDGLIEYRVRISRVVTMVEYDTVTIEAYDENDARDLVENKLADNPNQFYWETGDTIDSYNHEVEDVEEA